MIQELLVDETVLVSEEEILAHSMSYALQELHLVMEVGGAVGLAALLSRKVEEDLGGYIAVAN